jgi:hypothetical protein
VAWSKEQAAEYQRKWRARNPKRVKEHVRRYRASHKAEIAKRLRRWQTSERGRRKKREWDKRFRASKRGKRLIAKWEKRYRTSSRGRERSKRYQRAYRAKNLDKMRKYSAAYLRKYRLKYPERVKASDQKCQAQPWTRYRNTNKHSLKGGYAPLSKWGTKEEFCEWWEKQSKTRCKCCGKPFFIDKNKSHGGADAPCLDHCHRTGRWRGLIHHRCNVRLGRLEDLDFLRTALKYEPHIGIELRSLLDKYQSRTDRKRK